MEERGNEIHAPCACDLDFPVGAINCAGDASYSEAFYHF